MKLTPLMIADVLAAHHRRCELVRLAGGIAYEAVVDRRASVPAGWVLDEQTYYFIPPGLVLDSRTQ